jgi:uncharacterized SAM-binding protein YcdF (DUF218 family)
MGVSSQPPDSRPARGRVWPRRTLVAAALGIGCLILFFNRAAVLRTAADLWVVSDVPRAADAVVVLGGGLETRPVAAAAYYHRGLVNKVLIADAGLPLKLTGLIPSHAEVNRTVLIKLGVPDSAIGIFGKDLANTREEAMALRAWALRTHAGALIVPTEIFATRRVRWIMHHALEGTGTRVDVPQLDQREYAVHDWWRSERGIVDFQNEVLKYAYYRLKY